MSSEPRPRHDDERFTRAARAVTDAASSLTPPSAPAARARQQRHTTRIVGVVALVACVGLVAAVTTGRRADTRDLAVGAGPVGAGTTPGSTPGSTATPGSTPGSAPVVTSPFDPTVTSELADPPMTTAPNTPSSTTPTPEPTIPTETTTTTGPGGSTDAEGARWVLKAKGVYKGVGHYALFTEACRDLKHDLDLTFELEADGARTGTSWTLHADYCGSIDRDNVWSGEGPFTITMAEGSTLTGTLTSKAALPTSGVPYGLLITGGTGQVTDVRGSCALTINLHETSFGVQEQDGTFECEMTARGTDPRPVDPRVLLPY